MNSESDSETTSPSESHQPDPRDDSQVASNRRVFRFYLDQNDDKESRRQWTSDLRREAYERLATDPDVVAAVGRLREYAEALEGAYAGLPRLEIETQIKIVEGHMLLSQVLDYEATITGPPSIHYAIRRAFLAEQAFPPWFSQALTTRAPATPAEVWFSNDDTPYDLAPIQKGEIVVRFSAGIPARDVRNHVVPLVTEALKSLMNAGIAERRRGGLSRLEDDPETRLLAIQATRLSRWDKLSPTDIARRLGLAGPKENPYDPRVRQEAQRLDAAGDRAMIADWGADWEDRQEEIERIEAERAEIPRAE